MQQKSYISYIKLNHSNTDAPLFISILLVILSDGISWGLIVDGFNQLWDKAQPNILILKHGKFENNFVGLIFKYFAMARSFNDIL